VGFEQIGRGAIMNWFSESVALASSVRHHHHRLQLHGKKTWRKEGVEEGEEQGIDQIEEAIVDSVVVVAETEVA
jgi:hypothetical protein